MRIIGAVFWVWWSVTSVAIKRPCGGKLDALVVRDGNLRFVNFARPLDPSPFVNQPLLRLADAPAHRLFADFLAQLESLDAKLYRMEVDLTGHVWTAALIGNEDALRLWFKRDVDLRATRAYIKRRNYTQHLVVTSPARLIALEHLLRLKIGAGAHAPIGDLETFDRLPTLTEGFLL